MVHTLHFVVFILLPIFLVFLLKEISNRLRTFYWHSDRFNDGRKTVDIFLIYLKSWISISSLCRFIFYNNVNGIILVHDLTNFKSLQNLSKWLNDVLSYQSTGGLSSVKIGAASNFGYDN